MKTYFHIQVAMFDRKLIEMGLNPIAGYLLVLISFIILVEYLFLKSTYASYFLMLIGLSFLFKLQTVKRTEFLKQLFGDKRTNLIRILENLIVTIPFSIALSVHAAFLESICLILCAISFVFIPFRFNYSITLPTPFHKHPFEFLVGFRGAFLLLPLIYFLLGIALYVDNYNLGIISMLLLFLLTLTFYFKPEDPFFIWVFSLTPSKFLLYKLRTGTVYTFFFVFPAVFILSCFYPNAILTTLLFSLIGFLFIWVIILAKYAAYPNEMNLPEVILIAFCVYFPFLLLLLIPYFFSKSIKKLNTILK